LGGNEDKNSKYDDKDDSAAATTVITPEASQFKLQ
jgi:hypothetical protein